MSKKAIASSDEERSKLIEKECVEVGKVYIEIVQKGVAAFLVKKITLPQKSVNYR